ncbi:hypothetical protein GCM10029963_04100 [Micromonospora andamanensis]
MRSFRPRRLTALLALSTLLITAAPPAAAADASGKPGRSDGYHRVGYFTQWGIYGRAFPVKKLDTSGAASRLTHVNYAFGNVSEDGRCYVDGGPGEGDAWADYQRPVPAEESVDGVADAWGEPLNGNFGQLAKLKAKHPGLKVMISLGGWSWSTYFSNAARTDASRRAFVASCIDLYLKGNLPILDGGSGGPGAAAGVFDGIDLDWEWPNWPGEPGNVIRPEDRENFTKLLAEFRRQLDAYGRQTRRHHPLTAFLPANPATMDAGYEGRKIFTYLDFATVQGYDFHGTWEAVTNQQSALRVPKGAPDDPDFSVEVAISGWIARGRPDTSSSSASRTTARAGPASPVAGTGCSSRPPGPLPPPTPPGSRITSSSRTWPATASPSIATCAPGTPGCSTARPSGRTTTRRWCCRRRSTSGGPAWAGR